MIAAVSWIAVLIVLVPAFLTLKGKLK